MFQLYSRNISTFFLVVSTLFSKYYDFNLVILDFFYFFYVALKRRRTVQISFHGEKKLSQIWNNMTVRQDFHFQVNYC